MIQAGLFFTMPLFLSVVLGLNALQTGVRLLPLSITLLIAAVGIPKVWPTAVAAAGGPHRAAGCSLVGIVLAGPGDGRRTPTPRS